MTTRQPTQKEIEQIKAMSKQGLGCTAIAKSLHAKNTTIRWWCQQYAIEIEPWQRPPTKHLSPEVKVKIKELAAQGNTRSQISKALNTPRTTVCNYIARQSLETARSCREVFRPTPEQIDLIKELYADNLRLIDIADRLDVGIDALINKIRELKLTRKPVRTKDNRRKITPKEEATLRRLVAAGASQCEIRRKLSVVPSIFQRWAKELGLELSNKQALLNRTEETERIVRDLIASGAPRSAIATAIGVSIPTAVKYARSLGLEVPNHRSTAIDKPRSPKPPRKEKVKIEKVVSPKPQKPKPVPVAKTIVKPHNFNKTPYEIDDQTEKELARMMSGKRLLTVGFR